MSQEKKYRLTLSQDLSRGKASIMRRVRRLANITQSGSKSLVYKRTYEMKVELFTGTPSRDWQSLVGWGPSLFEHESQTNCCFLKRGKLNLNWHRTDTSSEVLGLAPDYGHPISSKQLLNLSDIGNLNWHWKPIWEVISPQVYWHWPQVIEGPWSPDSCLQPDCLTHVIAQEESNHLRLRSV